VDCWVWGGVDGLRDLKKEAEAVHPVDTSAKMRRKIKPKGLESTRRSDRQLGEDIVADKIDFGVTSRSLQALRKGGYGGRIRSCDDTEWNYFPSIGLNCRLEREKKNRNAFTSVNTLKDNRVQVNEQVNEKVTCRGTHRICDLKNIERSFNKQCTCFCFINHTLDDFIDYCCSIDKTFVTLKEMKKRYKLKEKSKIIITEKCLGIATTVEVSCSRCKEKAIVEAVPSKFKGKTLEGKEQFQKSSNWYELNLKLGLGTMASGIGPSNLSQLLSFLDLPNCKTIDSRFFNNMELAVGSTIRKVSAKSMDEATNEEVKLTLADEIKQKQFEQENLLAMITVSFDMGWNKRSSGNRYDSLSGHALAIGCLSNKILNVVVSSKICRLCSIARENGEEPPEHVCPQNYEGSSKAMEADAALTLYKDIYNKSGKRIHLQAVVADDDSSMRALLKHRCNNPKGRLPEDMNEPDWLADPSHRTKVVAKPIYHLASLSNKISICTKLDAMRIKKYFGYMIKTNRTKSIPEIVRASKAVVEHLFGNHEFCDEKWCQPKVNARLKRKEEGSQSHYRCKEKDKELYTQILKA